MLLSYRVICRGNSWLPGGKLFSSTHHDMRINIWGVSDWTKITIFSGYSGTQFWIILDDLVWSPNGTYLVSCGRGNGIQIWKIFGRSLEKNLGSCYSYYLVDYNLKHDLLGGSTLAIN